jgi:hypothetical protein
MKKRTKNCGKCKISKCYSLFSKDSSRKDGYEPYCKSCKTLYRKKYQEKNPDKIRNSWYKRRYNIDMEEYNEIYLLQNSKCKICDKEKENNISADHDRLVVDHCHKSGEVRGLLCQKCNRGLGYFEDKIENLLSAVIYLDRVYEKKN